MKQYSIKTILSTFTDKKGNKLTLLNPAPVGGISKKLLILFFIALPFLEYFAIFNPYVYGNLGLVSSIVIYIVFMSIIIMLVVLIVYMTKKSVIKKIKPSWKTYFKDIDPSMVLAVGITPYSDFFKHYSKLISEELNEEKLYEKLKESFKIMEEENSELLIAINKDNKNI